MNNIEPLESRIAPASVFKFTDVDGDNVVITSSVGDLNVVGVATLFPAAIGEQLHVLDLRGSEFQGANISIVATRDPVRGGDGFVNVGRINATGRDLGTVRVDGDLGALDAGDGVSATSACKGLTAQSLGRFGTSTGPDLVSEFDGKLDKLTVKADVNAVRILVSDSVGTNAMIGAITIGGSLIGGAASQTGFIFAEDGIGAVTIGGDVLGGSGDNSGKLRTLGTLGPVKIGGSVRGNGAFSGLIDGGVIVSVKIGGSLIGGTGGDSGEIFAGISMGSVTIGGDVQGGTGSFSGAIRSSGTIGAVKIGHSLIGGLVNKSGQISSVGDMGAVKIGHDVQGGSAFQTGFIESLGKLAGVSIGGSLIGGAGIASGTIFSDGDLGAVKIGHDVRGGSDLGSGSINTVGKLAGVTIGGSLIGGAGIFPTSTGAILSDGDMGPVKIGHNVKGGSGSESGFISSGGRLAGVTIGGSLIGDAGGNSGGIASDGDMGAVKIGHDMQGAAGIGSGFIESEGKLAGVTLGGSLLGGSGGFSGVIFSTGDIGAVKIGGDLTGASIASGSLNSSGLIESSAGRIASATIGGSIIAGVDNSPGGNLTRNASIRAGNDIGAITVKGSLIGNVGSGGDLTDVIISARGQAAPTTTTDLTIGKINIGGRVERAQILAGYDAGPRNADAQIGTVTVSGDWIASNLLAGVEAGPDNIIGNSDDRKITNTGQLGFKDTADLNGNGAISRIAAVVIKGRALGTADSTDSALFGIEAQHIVSLKIGGVAVPLTTGAGNDLFANRRPLGVTLGTSDPDGFDIHAFEVPLT